MIQLPEGFQLDEPKNAPTTPPSGFQLAPTPSAKPAGNPMTSLGQPYSATGEVVDGDTIRISPNLTGRLYGADAFETGQMGYRTDMPPIDLGKSAADMLKGYLRPQQTAYGTGAASFGRPVVTLGSGDTDPVRQSLLSGTAIAAPEFLKADPTRLARYMEDERLARLNRQGAHATEFSSPDAYRAASRWNRKLRPDESLQWESDLPELRPELRRLSSEQEGAFYEWLAGQQGNPNFGQSDLDAYWTAQGYQGSAPADDRFFEAVRKGIRIGPINYSEWDKQTLQQFKMDNGFAGMRPDIQQAYHALLSAPETDITTIERFAETNGLSFDPRDVADFFAARKRGEDPSIPIPIINPNDGRSGAFARGLADPFGFLDEAGGALDALAPDWAQKLVGGQTNRENIWNSDRSFGDIYQNNTRQNRAIIDYDETAHPFARAGGQLASGFLIPYGGGVRGISGLAKVGLAEGAVYGFGSGDGTLTQRLANVPLNAGAGALAGGALGGITDLAAPMLSRYWRSKATTPASPASVDVSPPAGFQIDTPAPPTARSLMEIEHEAPQALIGPPLPDAAVRPTLLSDGPPRAVTEESTQRIEPRDILPRPANELTEANAETLAKGPYPEVAAPRERDYLQVTQYPSARDPNRMISHRGPADLVTFARTQGGLRDEGGELATSGITNARRSGDDFTGGENRLGPLVDNRTGLSFEEMAQRAHSEGYFPELDTPPTRQEFMAALDDTYRATNRRFRPQDQPQIDAYHGALDQRYAVERARQAGEPLIDDVGQPASLDDIISNTPPATAYDDWNNAIVSQVGNVRVDKLDSPQDIGQALKVADHIGGGFEAGKRGKISFAETQALAQDLGMTADDLLARRRGQAFSAEEAYMARVILAKSGNELVNMARRLRTMGDDPGSAAMADFRKALVRHAAIQEQVSGMTAEAGRALSQFRMVADSREISGRVLEGLVNAGGGPQKIKDIADAIIDLERDPTRLNQFIEKVEKPKFKDRALEIWYNYLLSGPQTHAVNILSNTLTALSQLPEHAVAAGIGATRKAMKRDELDRVLFSEVGARTIGLLQGTKEGLKAFSQALRTGEPADFISKVEHQSQPAVEGLKGEVLRIPTRLLTAEDELFKAVARRMELTGLAVRKAASEGLKGQQAKDRAAELLANPTDDMIDKALDYGRYVTFQQQLGPLASKVSKFTNDHPWMKAVLPFIRTPTNLIKYSAERSPLAPMLREWRKDFTAGGPRRDLAIARSMVGTGIAVLIAEMAQEGKITGSAPTDKNRANLLYADGWQPHSFKIGDTYYSYRRLDPFALTFGTATDLVTLGDGMTDSQREEGAGLLVASVMSNLVNKTWLTGISDALEALTDPGRNAGNFIKRLVGSATVPTGAAQLARTLDPVARKAPDIASYMQSRMPEKSKELFPRRDAWGAPIVNEGGVGPDIISPIWTSTDRNDPITREVLRVGATVSPAKQDGMSEEQYDRLLPIVGRLARSWIADLMQSDEYAALPTDEQADEIGEVMKAARKEAKAHVLGGEELDDVRPVKKRRGSKRAQAVPEGFAVEKLPDGFVLD